MTKLNKKMMEQRFDELVKAYLDSKKDSWSPASLRSEGYRMRVLSFDLIQDPVALWKHVTEVKRMKPYTVKTLFIRAGELLEFAMERGDLPHGPNVIKNWMSRNASKFKHAYDKKKVPMTFEEAQRRIMTLEDEGIREKALQLLATGMRFTESTTLDKDGRVEGKGGRRRLVPLADKFKAEKFDKSYGALYYHLKKIGLTPHMLRKLCATKMAELGAQEADLMAMFGWRSSHMASLYVQAQREKELTEKMASLLTKEGKKNVDDRD